MEYRRFSEAPDDAREYDAVATFYDMLDLSSSKAYSLMASLLRLPGRVAASPNGSFHAYNVNVFYYTKLRKWNPKGLYPKYGEYVNDDEGHEARDSDVLYLHDEDYGYFIAHRDALEELLDSSEVSPRAFSKEDEATFSTAAEFVSYLDERRKKASKAWNFSRKF